MSCHHFDSIEVEDSASAAYRKGCAECLALGDEWVHLRECLVCGHVGCCDSSKNKHATKHFHSSAHAVIRSVEPGEQWGWCYVDEVMVELE